MNLLSKLPIPASVTRTIGKLALKLRKASPELMVGGGIVLGVATVGLAVVKTFEHKETLERDIKRIRNAKAIAIREEEIETVIKDEDGNEHIEKATVTTKRDMTEEEVKAVWSGRFAFAKDICKIYWQPIITGVSSVGLVWHGRGVLRKDLLRTSIAYAGLAKKFNDYRGEIAKEIGEEREQEIANGYSLEERVDPETGKKELVPVLNPEGNMNQFSFWFNEGYYDKEKNEWAWRNFSFDRSKIQNRLFVGEMERKYTYKLRTEGYFWLEDLALEFGIDPEEAKQFHDWGRIYKEDCDNKVSFGVFEGSDQLTVNRGFCDDSCSQNVCLINPNNIEYIGFVRDDYRKYDKRYGYGDMKYLSTKRESDRLLQRYNKEKMEQMVLKAMSKAGRDHVLYGKP